MSKPKKPISPSRRRPQGRPRPEPERTPRPADYDRRPSFRDTLIKKQKEG
jgi:hypothetical protein